MTTTFGGASPTTHSPEVETTPLPPLDPMISSATALRAHTFMFAWAAYLLLHHSAVHEVGAHTAAAQVADQLTTATLVGVGGALLALLATPAAALTALLVPLAALAVLGALVAPRAG